MLYGSPPISNLISPFLFMRFIYHKLKRIYFLLFGWIYRLFIRYNHTNKVALCCIAKCENDYIKEFVDYYRTLGFDKIFIYDNNDSLGENLLDVLSEDVKEQFCEIIDYRDKKVCQLEAYQDCYDKHQHQYDWMAFFDCDEFLTFTRETDIKDFLNRKDFKNYQLIHVNWMMYGDNELLENDKRGVIERFVNPIFPYNFKRTYNFPENNHVKTIVRGNLSDISWRNPHTPICSYYRCCNPTGRKCNSNSPFSTFDFSVAYLRHYCSKTIDEWLKIKQKRGYPDQNNETVEVSLSINAFFKINKWTREKQKIIDSYEVKMQPTISIITVSYNAVSTIEDTILSVINQTYHHIEYIIIDGLSTDGTVDIIKKYESQIAYWVSEPDRGIYDAMNKGLKIASGDFVYFLGADDLLFSRDTIAIVANRINERNSVYYGDSYFTDIRVIYMGKFNKYLLALHNICHQAIFYPRNVYSSKFYDEEFPIYADYVYNLELFCRVKYVYVDETISIFNSKGISKDGPDSMFRKERIGLIKNNLGVLPLIYAEIYDKSIFLRGVLGRLAKLIISAFK